MWNLTLILLTFTVMIGFLALLIYEKRRGTRIFARKRNQADHIVERAEFIIENVNLVAFVQDEIRHLIARTGHYVVYYSLISVRSIERWLTDLVRRLRRSPEVDTAPRETAREFVKTLSDFKENLKTTHPEKSDIN